MYRQEYIGTAPAARKIIAACYTTISSLLPKKITAKNISTFLKPKEEAVSNMVAVGNFSDTRLHSIRKNLKDLLYITKIYKQGSVWPFLNPLLENLGNFHDQSVAIRLLQSPRYHHLQKDNMPLLQLKTKWAAEKKRIKKIVIGQLHQYFAHKKAG